MTRQKTTVFVLWGEHFDEEIAVNAITTLRKSGQRVQIVGLNGRKARGIYGITLVADMTLSTFFDELDDSENILIPCDSESLQRIQSDPRVSELLIKSLNVTHLTTREDKHI